MTVCERIDGILKERKVSRRKLALMAGISPSSFQTAMSRNTTISYDMLIPISRVLKVPIYELMGYSLEYDTPENRAIAEIGFDATFGKDGAANVLEWEEVPLDRVHAEQQARLENRMKQAFLSLNEVGQKVACERVEELAKIDDYKQADAAQGKNSISSPPDDKKPPEGAETPTDGNK